LKDSTKELINSLNRRYRELSGCPVQATVEAITDCYRNDGKLLVCGNGGSASDALHIVGELMKSFQHPRTLGNIQRKKIEELFPDSARYLTDNLQNTLPAISLVSEIALLTASINDQPPDLCYAQQVLGYGRKGDILLAISTSGNSQNIIFAAQVAKVLDMKVISLTGSTGGKLKKLSDLLIAVPADETHLIQEYHLPVYHTICAAVENEIY
jgi:D-sedoheptulose 7-phosphate isomerase